MTAAAQVLARDPSASLAEVARAAQVGRTTLHRYFPDRDGLIDAVGDHVVDRVIEAHGRADLTDGLGRSAVLRLAHECFELGGLLNLIFLEHAPVSEEAWARAEVVEAALVSAVARGHLDGSIDSGLPADWVPGLMWSVLYAGWARIRDGQDGRRAALELVLRSLEGAISAGTIR